ncbi:MAG: hypothetical protein M1814_005143 [Vezdaea aestivalis]|nr:MAG: hypothetical protein M1814_005143 [Vezdaea aestivalis]
MPDDDSLFRPSSRPLQTDSKDLLLSQDAASALLSSNQSQPPCAIDPSLTTTSRPLSSPSPTPATPLEHSHLRPDKPPIFSATFSTPPTSPDLSVSVSSSLLTAGLRLQTDFLPRYTIAPSRSNSLDQTSVSVVEPESTATSGSTKTNTLSAPFAIPRPGIASLTPSALSSPALGPLTDITPLPSPIFASESPKSGWRKIPSRPSSRSSDRMAPQSAFVTSNGETLSAAVAVSQQRKAYFNLVSNPDAPSTLNTASHAKNRSISDYVPEPIQINRGRNVTISSTEPITPTSPAHLRREAHLAEKRGLVSPHTQQPTPPSSTRGRTSSASSLQEDRGEPSPHRARYFDARGVKDNKRRRWRAVYLLGEGTFSKVYLATSHETWAQSVLSQHGTTRPASDLEKDEKFDGKRAVAIKVAQHGAAGGVDELKIRNGLKRELDILKSVHHPSVVRLKAFKVEVDRSIFVMTLCAGGDLFELASHKKELLTPPLIQRIFSELVAALQYLHDQAIIHRDVKLENVLVNMPYHKFPLVSNWQTYPYSVITLTDMGLSKRIDPAHPTEDTRCGSEEYCAPEIIMGQGYDGRSTDGWALGVLLFGLLESRLPFDPPPGLDETDYAIQLSRTKHRIARIEYVWIKFGDEDGDAAGFGVLDGARQAVQGLLLRATRRTSLAQVALQDWVREGIDVPQGVRFKEEHDPEEV